MDDTNKKSVLLVDDDRFLLDIYKTTFTEAGYNVEVGVGAADALHKIKSGKHFDAMITDARMPAVDGVELVERMRKENLLPGVPILILTNDTTEETMARAREAGIKDYLVKSETIPANLVQRVNTLISPPAAPLSPPPVATPPPAGEPAPISQPIQ